MKRAVLTGVSVLLLVGLVALGARTSTTRTADMTASGIVDSTPGFGKSARAVLRDDTIALYESWRRETIARDCMAKTGFLYQPEFLYSPSATLNIARELGVSASALPAPRADVTNETYLRTLSPSDLDRYALTMWGETHNDLESVDDTALLPSGRDLDTFAIGGCQGVARAAVPGVWELPRHLSDALTEAREQVPESPEFEQVRAEFDSCASEYIPDPETIGTIGELEELVAENVGELSASTVDLPPLDNESRPTKPDYMGAFEHCATLWAVAIDIAAEKALEPFVQAHGAALAAQRERYKTVIDAVREDQAFLLWLRDVVYYLQLDNAGLEEN